MPATPQTTQLPGRPIYKVGGYYNTADLWALPPGSEFYYEPTRVTYRVTGVVAGPTVPGSGFGGQSGTSRCKWEIHQMFGSNPATVIGRYKLSAFGPAKFRLTKLGPGYTKAVTGDKLAKVAAVMDEFVHAAKGESK